MGRAGSNDLNPTPPCCLEICSWGFSLVFHLRVVLDPPHVSNRCRPSRAADTQLSRHTRLQPTHAPPRPPASLRTQGLASGMQPNGAGGAAWPDSASPPAIGRAPPLARQATPLLPCGLTAEELAAITTAVDSPERRSSPIPEAQDLSTGWVLGRRLRLPQQCSRSAPRQPWMPVLSSRASLLPLLQASG